MKIYLSKSEAIDLLLQDDNANWSIEACHIIVEHIEENFDENYDFNVIDIRCEYDEWKNLDEYNKAYDTEHTDELDIDCLVDRDSRKDIFVTFCH